MSPLNTWGLISGTFCLLPIFVNICPSRSLMRVQDIKFKEYYVTSSKIYGLNHHGRQKRDDVLASSRPEFLFDIKLYNDGRPFTVYIRQRDSDVLADQKFVLTIFNASNASSEFGSIITSKETHLYEGYLTDYPDNSSVNGYLKDGNFYGHLIVNETFYYIDELREPKLDRWRRFNDTIAQRNALIFKRDAMIIGVILNETKSAKDMFLALVKTRYYHDKFKSWKQNGMLCPLVVVIDNSFLTVVHKSNVEAATFQVLLSLEEANAVFRSTDFDGDGIPDNIGFYVKKVVVIAEAESVDFIPEFQYRMRVDDFLSKFIKFEELSKHCLGIAFTAQKFEGGTLGASYTPDSTSLHPISGICDERMSIVGTLNGLVITASTVHSPLVNQLVFEVTIIHELGHSFGSPHDNVAKCFGHVMSPKAYDDYHVNRTRMVFSSCSRTHIMRTLVMKGACFEPTQISFCGNGIVEEDEDCDCGLTRDCLAKDPCCIPRRTKEYPCKINRKRGFECHPSQGECCTDKCKYNRRFFVYCKDFEQTCPCANTTTTTSNNNSCACGLNGMCIGNECHSVECTRLGLKECKCHNKPMDKYCQTCCKYEDNCVSAMEATNTVLSSANGNGATRELLLTKLEETIFKTKQSLEKEFCVKEGRCVYLSFFIARVGDYCLRMAKSGKCQRDLQCNISQSQQSFPSLAGASGTLLTQQGFVHMVCYLLLNSFLIYSFY